jgi:hypothetical protein
VRHQESRPGYDTAGSGRQRRAGVTAGRNSTGQEHRALTGHSKSVRQEVQGRHGSDKVATGFSPLSDQTVSAPGGSAASLRLGTNHHEDEDPDIPQMLDKPATLAECKHDDIHTTVDTHRNVTATHEGHQQIYRDGTTRGLLAHLTDRGS